MDHLSRCIKTANDDEPDKFVYHRRMEITKAMQRVLFASTAELIVGPRSWSEHRVRLSEELDMPDVKHHVYIYTSRQVSITSKSYSTLYSNALLQCVILHGST